MNKEYYIEYFELERNHWWFKVREKIIEDRLKKNLPGSSSLKILNIGAATGRTTEMLSQFGEVTSIEYDKDCCTFTSMKLGIPILNASILDLPFTDQSFDVVCAFDVIEHVQDDLKGVEEMNRVCKSGGIIFITVPAFMQLWSHHDVVNQHYRRYTMKEVIKLFTTFKGFILHKTYFNSLLFLPILGFRTISKLIPSKTIRKGSGSDFSVIDNDSFVNRLLYKVFDFERTLLTKISFSAGVSILFMWKKQDN